MTTTRLGPHQRRVLQLLEKNPAGMTRRQLQEQTGVTDLRTIQRMLNNLHERHLIHVKGWTSGHSHPPARIYGLGAGKDAKRPPRLTRSESRKRHVAKVGREIYNMTTLARLKGRTRLVIDGVTVWQRGIGILALHKPTNQTH